MEGGEEGQTELGPLRKAVPVSTASQALTPQRMASLFQVVGEAQGALTLAFVDRDASVNMMPCFRGVQAPLDFAGQRAEGFDRVQ